MKKITFAASVAFLLLTSNAHAQLDILGIKEHGRIFDLTYDKVVTNKAYAITLNNHIVVTNDNGSTWELFYSLPLTFGANIKQLKLSPDGNFLTFVAYDDDYKIIVLELSTKSIVKTYDIPVEEAGAWMENYDFFGSDHNILLVTIWWYAGLATEAKVYTTNNGGTMWKEVYYTLDHDEVSVGAARFGLDNPNNIFIGRAGGKNDVSGGLWISNDGGTTFTEKLDNINVKTIAINPSNNDIYVGKWTQDQDGTSNLYRSKDNGNSWEEVNISWNNTGVSNNINFIQFNPNNAQQIIVLEEDEVARSFDGGLTWLKKEYPTDNLDSYYDGNNLSFNSNNDILLSQNYKPMISHDNGETFIQVSTPYFNSDSRVSFFEKDGKKDLYYGVQYGNVHYDLNNQVQTSMDIVPLSTFGYSNSSHIFADPNVEGRIFKFRRSSFGSDLYISVDNGLNYSSIYNTFADKIKDLKPNPSNSNEIFASFSMWGDGELVKINYSDLDNVTVTPIYLPEMAEVSSIFFPDNNEGHIILAQGAKLYKSTNGGENWTNFGVGLTDLFEWDVINQISQNPFDHNEWAIATSQGIFTTNDAGENWSQKMQDDVKFVKFSDTSNGKVIAANLVTDISYFELYHSSNHGNTWTHVEKEKLNHTESRSIDVDFTGNSAYVYIASKDLGIVGYNISFETLSTIQAPNKKIQVYPNPTSDLIYINEEKISRVEVYNMVGNKLMETKKNIIDISDFYKGSYILKITTKDQRTFSQKIIKK